jgi:hypothetical protein
VAKKRNDVSKYIARTLANGIVIAEMQVSARIAAIVCTTNNTETEA